MADRFEGPKLTLAWANEQIAEFDAVSESFWKNRDWSCPRRYVKDDTTKQLISIVFPTDPTLGLRKCAYRVVIDLRNSLDQSVHAASELIVDRTGLKKTNFPFGESRSDFKKALTARKGNYRDIPLALHPLLLSFRPYYSKPNEPAGNDLLRSLARIANPNKHQVPLSVGVDSDGIFILKMKGRVGTLHIVNEWDSSTNTLNVGYFADTDPDIEFEFQLDKVIFPFLRAGLLTGKPALATFREMASQVQQIVAAIESETFRIIRG